MKFIFYIWSQKLRILLVLFPILLVYPCESMDYPQLDSAGELGMQSVYNIKPSSVQNQFAFRMPEARLHFYATFDPQVQAHIGLVYAKNRNPSNELWSVQVEEANFEFTDILSEADFVQYGLIPNGWLQLAEEYWPHRLVSPYSATISDRFSYQQRTDLGFKWGLFINDQIEFEIAMVNGEGAHQDETGSKKEIQSLIRGTWGDRLHWAAGGTFGNYENIEAELAKKERFQLLLSFNPIESWSFFLEALWAQDAVDAINKIIADKVDLTSEGGKVIRSQGASFGLRYFWDEKKEFFAKVDQLNPALGVDAKGLKQFLLGFGFFPRQYLQFSIAWGDVKYESNYASYVRDRSELVFSTQLKW